MRKLDEIRYQAMDDMAYAIRVGVTRMTCIGHWGHVGGSYSAAELLSVLYSEFVKLDPANPRSPDRDYVVFSKAHCSPALYSALAYQNIISKESLMSYCAIDGLDGHLDQLHTPGVEASGGSLGIGLSYSVGIAKALKMQERFAQRVYCVVGDGELSEGEIWEATMAASQYKLDNLIAIVDYNKVMAKGFIYEEMSQEPIRARFESFGWVVMEVDGHDVEELHEALYRAKYITVTGKPICIIAHTVKGRGVEQCEFNYKWHTHAPGRDKANEFLKDLAQRYGREYQPITEPIRQTFSLEDVVMGGDS